jgi:hypothetical protein
MTAGPTGSLTVILKKFHRFPAMGAGTLKHGLAAPISAILSWTLHDTLLKKKAPELSDFLA